MHEYGILWEFQLFYASALAIAISAGFMFLGCPSVHPFLVNAISQECSEGISSNWAQGPLGLKDELEFGSQSHCDLAKHIFGRNSRIHSLIITVFY